MIKKANVLFFLILITLLASAITVNAGILENFEKELTDLVNKTEPFLVTVEAKSFDYKRLNVGSGTLIDDYGYILTTASVIGENDEISVTFKDGDSYPAELIGIDNQSGIALLKIDPTNRQTPKLGDTRKLKEGSLIIVVGNSYEIPGSVNFGIYSGITDEGMLQISMQAGPGSSGGAVFNTKGEIIGILVAQTTETVSLYLPYEKQLKKKVKKYQSSGIDSYHKIGVDLPSSSTSLVVGVDRLNKIIDQLKKYGEVKHGFLGIKQKTLNKKTLRKHNIETGVLIAEVTGDSPADRAGLLKGDIIVKFNDTPVKGPGHLYILVRSKMPGDTVVLEVLREEGSVKDVKVTLGEVSDNEYQSFRDKFSYYPIDDNLLVDIQKNLESKFADLGDYLDGMKNYHNPKTDIDISELENKIKELENHLKDLSAQIDELSKKLKK